jgi:hypothetical protein
MLLNLSCEELHIVFGGINSHTKHEDCIIWCYQYISRSFHFDTSIIHNVEFGYSKRHKPDEMTSCVYNCEFPSPPSSNPEMDNFILCTFFGSLAVGYIGLLIWGCRNGLFR